MDNENIGIQAHALGKIYATLAKACPKLDTPARLNAAALHPLEGIAQLHNLVITNHKMNAAVEAQIAELFEISDPSFPETLLLEHQGSFLAGYYAGKSGAAIGKKIKELRVEKGLTQQQLADASGVPKQNISRWETGASKPGALYLKKISDALDVTVDELL